MVVVVAGEEEMAGVGVVGVVGEAGLVAEEKMEGGGVVEVVVVGEVELVVEEEMVGVGEAGLVVEAEVVAEAGLVAEAEVVVEEEQVAEVEDIIVEDILEDGAEVTAVAPLKVEVTDIVTEVGEKVKFLPENVCKCNFVIFDLFLRLLK